MTSRRPLTIYWTDDSYSVRTCHINDVKLTYDESLLATLAWDHNTNEWYYVLKGSDDRVGPYSNLNLVRAAVEAAVGGTQVQEVYR